MTRQNFNLSQDKVAAIAEAAERRETVTEAFSTPAFGAFAADQPLEHMSVERRAPGEHDVLIDIEFCGLCHSDIHAVRSEWREVTYPYVPGHEIVGIVRQVGAAVTRHKMGDRVGIGCLVDSCRECEACQQGLQQYCTGSAEVPGGVGTYGAQDYRNGGVQTQGGYTGSIVADESFVLSIPEGLDPAAAAPLLCAGITTFSPLNHLNIGSGSRVGVVGLGGLGHMAVKLAKAMGATVTVFSRSGAKKAAALELGADRYVSTSDEQQMSEAARSLDVIIDTVAAVHDLNEYLNCLDRDGTLVQVGLPADEMPPVDPRQLVFKRVAYMGSLIGGIPETQQMLDFCAEHGVTAQIEMVSADQINEAYDRMTAGDVQYRFVLDNSTLKQA